MRARVPAPRLALLAGVFLWALVVGSCTVERSSDVGGSSRRVLLQSKKSETRRETEPLAVGEENHDHEEDHSDEDSTADQDVDDLLKEKEKAGTETAEEGDDHQDEEHNDEHEDEHDDDHNEHVDEKDTDHDDDHDVHVDDHNDEHDDEHDDDHDAHVDEKDDEHHDDDDAEENHDHDLHGEEVPWFHNGHEHDESETSAEHLVEVYGGEGMLFPAELGVIFAELTGICKPGDKHNAHSHDDNHGHKKEKEILTPAMLVDEYGEEGLLDSSGLEKSCVSILRCQLEEGCELTIDEEHHDEDEDLGTLKVIIAVIFFVEAIVGALVPLVVGQFEKYKLLLSILNCFSGGVFISTGFVHVLPHLFETEAEVSGLGEYPLGTVIVVIGFMMVFFVEHILFDVHSDEVFQTTTNRLHSKDLDVRSVSQTKPEHDTQPTLGDRWGSMSQALVLLMAISVHAVLEALALGLESHKNGVLLLFASIGSHKGVAAMALSARFLRNGVSKKQIFYCMGAFSLIAPIGILCGLGSNGVAPLAKVILNGLSAGTFIYVGAYEVIADEFHDHHAKNTEKKPRSLKFSAVITGAAVIALLQMIPHEEHA